MADLVIKGPSLVPLKSYPLGTTPGVQTRSLLGGTRGLVTTGLLTLLIVPTWPYIGCPNDTLFSFRYLLRQIQLQVHVTWTLNFLLFLGYDRTPPKTEGQHPNKEGHPGFRMKCSPRAARTNGPSNRFWSICHQEMVCGPNLVVCLVWEGLTREGLRVPQVMFDRRLLYQEIPKPQDP